MNDTPQSLPIEIRNRWTDDVLYSSTQATQATTVRDAVIEANLSGANLSDADLSGANLIGANLSGANLRDADLSGAILSGANLRDAILSGANLRDAKLSGVNLIGANLIGANLRDADLSGAILSGVNLSGANLSDANLNGAKNISVAQLSFTEHGQCGRTLTAIQTKKEIHILCGCFSGSPDELRAWIAGDEKRFAKTRTLALDTALILLAAKNDEVGE
jgi:uncharacterized protein YjbI with pentapeptide repeats